MLVELNKQEIHDAFIHEGNFYLGVEHNGVIGFLRMPLVAMYRIAIPIAYHKTYAEMSRDHRWKDGTVRFTDMKNHLINGNGPDPSSWPKGEVFQVAAVGDNVNEELFIPEDKLDFSPQNHEITQENLGPVFGPEIELSITDNVPVNLVPKNDTGDLSNSDDEGLLTLGNIAIFGVVLVVLSVTIYTIKKVV